MGLVVSGKRAKGNQIRYSRHNHIQESQRINRLVGRTSYQYKDAVLIQMVAQPLTITIPRMTPHPVYGSPARPGWLTPLSRRGMLIFLRRTALVNVWDLQPKAVFLHKRNLQCVNLGIICSNRFETFAIIWARQLLMTEGVCNDHAGNGGNRLRS